MSLCVYALISPAARGRGAPERVIRQTGIAGERLRLIAVGRVAAVVGECARAPRPTAPALRAYDRLLQSLSARAAAIVPARFGTTMSDVEELRMVLESRQSTLMGSLRAVRGRAQMTLRVAQAPVASPAASTREMTTSAAATATTVMSGAAFLRARAAAAAQARHVAGFEPVRLAVRRWVRDERVEKHGQLASIYHLVPRGSVTAYRAALERAAVRAGVRVVISGPYPPYAFSTAL